jgi:hypothetical protein
MKRIILVFLSCISLIDISAAHGQVVDSSAVTSANYTVTFHPGEDYTINYANRIIRVIAEDVDKNFRDTRITFSFQLLISFLNEAEGKPNLLVRVKPGVFSGDIKYRGFNLSEVLFPTRLSGTLSFVNRRDSVVNFQVRISDRLVTEDFLVPVQGMGDPMVHLADSIHLSDVTFHYDKTAFTLFEKRVVLINDYFASGIITDTLLNDSRMFNPGNLANWPLYLIDLEEIAKMVSLLESRQFESTLALPSYDPLALADKVKELKRLSLSMNMTFQENLDKVVSIQSGYSMDSLSQIFVNGMLRYIRWSLYGNWQNGKIYDDYLSTYFTARGFGDDLGVVKGLLVKMYPNKNPDSLMRVVTNEVEEAYELISDRLTEQSQYAEAVALLENRREFVKNNPHSDQGNKNNAAYVKAVNGIYQSYLDVASKAMERGKMKLATTYFEKANNYRKEFSGFIMRDSVEGKVTQHYYAERMSECGKLTANGDFAEALECYTEFAQSLDTISFILLKKDLDGKIQLVRKGLTLEYLDDVVEFAANEKPDSAMVSFDLVVQLKKSFPHDARVDSIMASLYPKVELLRFRSWMDQAIMAVELRQFSLAYTLLQKARVISERMNYPPEPMLDSLQNVSYPKYMIDQLALSESLIWMNRFAAARVAADSIETEIDKTGHGSNLQLAEAVCHFREKIDQRICWNVKDTFDVLLLRAGKNSERKKYMRAYVLLDSAKMLSLQWQDCSLNVQGLRDTLAKYYPLFLYETLLGKSGNAILIGNFPEGVGAYNEADGIYRNANLDRFLPEPSALYDYIASRSNLSLVRYMIDLSQKQNNLNEAMHYLGLMRHLQCSASEAKDVMQDLAKKVAQQDFNNDPSGDPVILSRKSTQGDDWFANFERSYLIEWKRLKKETVKPTQP